jgi:exopolysaccharide biosynthesis polyprenyl glycosylphosphotransferase
MLREKARVVNNFLAIVDVIIAVVSYNLAVFIELKHLEPLANKDSIIIHFLLVFLWYILAKALRLNQLYRSRPYSVVLFGCLSLAVVGTSALILFVWIFDLYSIDFSRLLLFGVIDLILTFGVKMLHYSFMKRARAQGFNTLHVIVIGDHTARSFLRQIVKMKEWGYRIVGIIGTNDLEQEFCSVAPFLPENTDIEQLLRNKTIDEIIYCKETPSIREVEDLVQLTSEVGVIFRMYSSFFNMLTNKTHLHYFGTTPLLTISNTPLNYLELRVKAIFDFLFSAFVVIVFSPIYVLLALAIKLDSKGPIFFKQKRVGLRGRKFVLFKFRTMVRNAEELKATLMQQNEMDGPVFKMTNDPRITRVGRFLRKTSLDELPQFFNVLIGDMSIIGPRPPLPEEVKQYERWQLRRLSMKPGITCIWQVSGRNNIPFEEWMKMDLEYIDNWSLKLDFIIFLKTIRTMIRGDGK